MTIITDIFNTDVIDRLKNISTANGFANDVSVLDGYLVHYANDLLSTGNSINFPVVAAEPILETVINEQSNTKARIGRQIRLIGAISATDRTLVNQKFDSLLLDVRKALFMDKFNNASKAESIQMGDVTFSLPDSQDQYAYFEFTVTINYIERWNI